MSTLLSEKYATFCRPKIASLMKYVRLDVSYHKGEGDYLYYYDNTDNEIKILDFVGGFGSTVFGHNHPDLIQTAWENLKNKVPFSSQVSTRTGAAILSEKINTMLNERTGRTYITTLANTGAESTEAAIKHAELCQYMSIEKIKQNISETITKISLDYKHGIVKLPSDFAHQMKTLTRVSSGPDLAHQLEAITRHNCSLFQKEPVYLCLNKSFHGKTSGAVKLTQNDTYRIPFSRIGLTTVFIEPGDRNAVYKAIEDATINYLYPCINKKNEIVITQKKHVNISAFFIEPIQGEGGINIIQHDFLKFCRKVSTEYGFHLVFDEIQCGMGRTGTFLYSEQSGVFPDYYLLAKSLGGGLSKISALIIDSELYQPDFGYIHSSTFAEDDPSSNIAYASLNLLDQNPGLMANCTKRGDQLISGLKKVQTIYPGVIDEVRGTGLMLGITFSKCEQSNSATLRVLSEQNLLCSVIAGYLFHEHGIRVAPTLSNNMTIRIEPSAYISKNECEYFISAVERLAEIIYHQNAYELTRYIVSSQKHDPDKRIKSYRKPYVISKSPTDIRKVAFLGHYIYANHLRLWDESLSDFTDHEIDQYMKLFSPILDPQLMEKHIIVSPTGDKVEFNFIGLFLDSKSIAGFMKTRNLSLVREKVDKALEIATQHGCEVVGFGQFTSIITKNCTDITTDAVTMTTGNSYTVAMGVEALYQSALKSDIDISQSCCAVIGATGNICSVYSEIIAEKVAKIILIGRPLREKRLKRLAADILQQAFINILAVKSRLKNDDINGHITDHLQGIARVISETRAVNHVINNFQDDKNIGMRLFDLLTQELGDRMPVVVSWDYNRIKEADLIVSASNSPEPIIFPEMLGKGPIVICDIAVPEDTDESVNRTRKDVVVIRGGVVKLPLNPELHIKGLPLNPGQLYACMAETTLLGLTGIRGHYSYGKIEKTKVKNILEIAHKHKFTLARVRTEKGF